MTEGLTKRPNKFVVYYNIVYPYPLVSETLFRVPTHAARVMIRTDEKNTTDNFFIMTPPFKELDLLYI